MWAETWHETFLQDATLAQDDSISAQGSVPQKISSRQKVGKKKVWWMTIDLPGSIFCGVFFVFLDVSCISCCFFDCFPWVVFFWCSMIKSSGGREFSKLGASYKYCNFFQISKKMGLFWLSTACCVFRQCSKNWYNDHVFSIGWWQGSTTSCWTLGVWVVRDLRQKNSAALCFRSEDLITRRVEWVWVRCIFCQPPQKKHQKWFNQILDLFLLWGGRKDSANIYANIIYL